MNNDLLAELKPVVCATDVPLRTGFYRIDEKSPATYVIMLPTSETYEFYADDRPYAETQEVTLLIFSKGDSTALRTRLAKDLFRAGFTVSGRRFDGYDSVTEYYQYSIVVSKCYEIGGDYWN